MPPDRVWFLRDPILNCKGEIQEHNAQVDEKQSTVKPEIFLIVLGKRFDEGLCVTIKFLAFVFPLYTCRIGCPFPCLGLKRGVNFRLSLPLIRSGF